MLFTYSQDVAALNWLHDAIFYQLQLGMQQIDHDTDTIDWPDWLPEHLREKLGSRTGLRDHVANFQDAYRGLLPDARLLVEDALVGHNSHPDNLRGLVSCRPKDELPEAIREPATKLFSYAFRLLSELGCRDKQYADIYNSAIWKICPFCGIHRLDGVGSPREDLDHYLVFEKYPFCGANLKNLAPMCGRCNQRYKRHQDVIYDDVENAPCCASDPFAGPTFRICLNESPHYNGAARSPEWAIQILDDCQEANTWNRVFKITERYERDVLTPNFTNWVSDFGRWGARVFNKLPNVDELKQAIRDYISDETLKGFNDAAFLKVSVFGMFLNQLENGNPDLQVWLGDQIRIYL